MGKTKKSGQIFVPNRDIFQRINFLYQMAYRLMPAFPQNRELVRFYTQSVKTMAKKQVLRLDPSIKRNICKKCFMLLVPGLSASVRFRAKPERHCVVRCLDCDTVKRFLTREDYQLWGEQPEAWLEQSENS